MIVLAVHLRVFDVEECQHDFLVAHGGCDVQRGHPVVVGTVNLNVWCTEERLHLGNVMIKHLWTGFGK